MTAYRLQDPDETLHYSIDWDDGWLPSGETIASATWAITPTGPTVTDLGEDGTATISSAEVSGLTRGTVYRLTNTVTSSGGEIGERSLVIRCDHR